MMNTKGFVLVLLAMLWGASAVSAQQIAIDTSDLQPIPIELVPTFELAGFADALEQIDFLADMDEEYEGASVALYVSLHNKNTSADGAVGFTSLMLSSSTLGILPVTRENDLTLRYELRAHGMAIARHEFVNNFKGIQSFYSMNSANELRPEMEEWILSTVDELKQAYAEDIQLAGLRMNYNQIFVDGFVVSD